MSADQTPKGCMTIKQFIVWASVSNAHVYREIKRGKLKACRSGGRTLIKYSDAFEWLENLPMMEGAE